MLTKRQVAIVLLALRALRRNLSEFGIPDGSDPGTPANYEADAILEIDDTIAIFQAGKHV